MTEPGAAPSPIRVVMLIRPGSTANIIFNCLKDISPIHAVIEEKPTSSMTMLRRRVKKLGLARVIGQALFQAAIAPVLRHSAARRIRQILDSNNLDSTPIPRDLVVKVPSVNSQTCVDVLRALQPAIVVIAGTRIIASEIIECVNAAFLNIHAGITPRYRGVHGAYWALANDDAANCGATVHLVDRGIDTGGILAQARVFPTESDNFATYPYLQLAAALPLLAGIVQAAPASLTPANSYPDAPSRLWHHPTFPEYLRNRRRGIR